MPSITKSILLGAVAAAAPAAVQGTPIAARQDSSLDPATYSSYDWDPILNAEDNATCAPLAVIFARGTFDWANIGPWVGAPFRDAIKSAIPDAAVQGVDPSQYAADLSGYIDSASPDSCGTAIADAINTYGAACPDTKFAVAGWSQGALCAHKAFDTSFALTDASRVISLTTFGDPAQLFTDDLPSIPSNVQTFSYCESTTPDPLCGDPLADLETDSASDFIDELKDMWDQFDRSTLNDAQSDAIDDLISDLFDQFWGELDSLAGDILSGDLQRWMLTPQHFYYGLDNSDPSFVVQAAEDLAGAYGA